DAAQLQCADGSLRRLIDALQSTRIAPLPAPTGFAATLRPYQQEGLGWLRFLRGCDLGGILADDMGLGKAAQTHAHLLPAQHQPQASGASRKASLMGTPVSVIGNW